jgi:hypothetical protein
MASAFNIIVLMDPLGAGALRIISTVILGIFQILTVSNPSIDV